jgi:hypothetical protein
MAFSRVKEGKCEKIWHVAKYSEALAATSY